MTDSDFRRPSEVDMVIVGAGFSGLYMQHKARSLGLSFRMFERGSDVGGTWYWNCYPGARCDVESMEYSFSFDNELQQDWDWTERFATQPEILSYLQHVADRFDMRRDIEFGTSVEGARFVAADNRWDVRTDKGENVRARYLIMATGCLSASRVPEFEGLDTYEGETFHTGQWPHGEVDFTGKRVGVIGTGSSGVQAIPMIARQAKSLHVFQRTPTFSVPARNRPLSADQIRDWKRNYPDRRRAARETLRTGWHYEEPLGRTNDVSEEARDAEFHRRWHKGGSNFLYAFSDIGLDESANAAAADFVRARIGEIVEDPETAAQLMPYDYPIGAKRICVDTDFYTTFNRDNVTLADLKKAPIVRFTPKGLETTDTTYDLDAVVFATGYDAMTGSLTRLDLEGRDGARLADKWDAGPTNYLGIMTTGFPNFFMITGPGSPSVLSNVVVSIEQHVEWLADLFAYMRDNGLETIEPTPEAEREWVDHCRGLAEQTLHMRANSWYLGANVPGKPRVFMPYIGGTVTYRKHCAQVAAEGYTGFRLTGPGNPDASADVACEPHGA